MAKPLANLLINYFVADVGVGFKMLFGALWLASNETIFHLAFAICH
jgi:hypothetical protein